MGRNMHSITQTVGPHFLLLPFVELGHMNPMLNLASQLAAIPTFDCKVTFVNATQIASAGAVAWAEHIESSDTHVSGSATAASSNGSSNFVQYLQHVQEDDCVGDRLQFVNLLPSVGGRPPRNAQFEHVSTSSRHTVFKQKLTALENLTPVIEKMVHESKDSDHPVSCIVCDVLLWKWVQKVADRHGVRLALLVPCCALAFLTGYAYRLGKGAELEELLVSGFNLPTKNDGRPHGLLNVSEPPDVRINKIEHFRWLMEGIEHARVEYLMNSFEQLEEPLLPFIQAAGVKMTFVAPYAGAAGETSISVGNRRTKLTGSVLVQEEECIEWLRRQETGSVLYVSFGSEGVLEETQVQEIAMGIEQSGYRYLWVVRPDWPAASRPPEDFRRRSRQEGRGMFVGWAPQRAVLQHVAVGAFLTHNGWNSTLESLSCGVPMLCLPLLGDQTINANLVHWYWQVGLRLQPAAAANGQYVVSRGDVERGVRTLMEGGRFSNNAKHFQRSAEQAASQAQLNVNSFAHRIMTCTSNV